MPQVKAFLGYSSSSAYPRCRLALFSFPVAIGHARGTQWRNRDERRFLRHGQTSSRLLLRTGILPQIEIERGRMSAVAHLSAISIVL